MKKNISVIEMGIQALAILYCVLSCIYTIFMGGGEGAQRGPAILCLAALAATVFYIAKGHTKSAAKSFKVMLLLCAAASVMCLLPHLYDIDLISAAPNAAAFIAIGYALCFGLYLVLALVPDLGKTKSAIIIGAIFCIFVVIHVFFQITLPGALISDGSRADSMRLMRMTCMCCLSLSAMICIHFKYVDKAARGSK